jgi:SecD/SecF fusion protein
LASEPFFPASSSIGGTVAGGARIRAFYALVVSWMCMIVYLWVRFQKVAFGVAAVVALIHDVFVMVGAIALSYYVAPMLGFLGVEQFKIGLPEVVAMLTIIGYSVNDTIVIFDRIREIRGKDPSLTKKMVNDATNQTMSRTLLTAFTVALVTVILYAFGGEAIHGMMFALIIGEITGCYSSIYVAAPILLWLIHPKPHTQIRGG